MIKINLLSEGKRPAAVRKARATPGEDVALWLLLVGAFVGILVAAGHWWVLNGRLQDKQNEVAQAQKQVDALQAVINEVESFKVKKKNLTDKIQVINDLKSNQQGPVRIMDYVSRALPELLWLDHMQLTASTITLEGRAFNPNAVAAFMENMDKVPEFKEGVLKDITAQNNQVYKFVITFDYSFAPKKADDTTPAVGAAGKPGAPAGPAGPAGQPGSGGPAAAPPATPAPAPGSAGGASKPPAASTVPSTR